MTNKQHTAAPWQQGLGREYWHILSERKPVAILQIGNPNAEANARLIAAAPELLEALDDLYRDLQGRLDDGALFNPGTMQALSAARAAIAKAKGV